MLLQASAPAEAIVFAPASGHGDERRHMVDHRLLRRVTVVERLPDATIGDLANERRHAGDERRLSSQRKIRRSL